MDFPEDFEERPADLDLGHLEYGDEAFPLSPLSNADPASPHRNRH